MEAFYLSRTNTPTSTLFRLSAHNAPALSALLLKARTLTTFWDDMIRERFLSHMPLPGLEQLNEMC